MQLCIKLIWLILFVFMYKKRIFGLLVLGSEMVNFPLRIWEYFVLKNCHSEGQLALEVESLSERFCLLLKCYFLRSIKEKSNILLRFRIGVTNFDTFPKYQIIDHQSINWYLMHFQLGGEKQALCYEGGCFCLPS